MSQPRRRSSASCCVGLDALGHRRQAEGVGQGDDGGDDGRVRAGVAGRGRRRTSGRPSARRPGSGAGRSATSSRCRSRRRAGCTPRSLSGRECPRASRRRRLDEHALGDLEAQRATGSMSVPLTSARRTSSTRLGLARAGGADRLTLIGQRPDRRGIGACQLPSLAARLLEHPRADGDDEAGLLGDADEVVGSDQAPLGVLPADQRLDAARSRRSPASIDRLVVQTQLVALAGPGAGAFSMSRRSTALAPHAVVEDLARGPRPRSLARYMAASASRRSVLGRGGDVVGEGDADAGADEDLGLVDQERAR